MSDDALYHLIERLGNWIRNETRGASGSHGLQPVQLDALAYLCRCNRYSDTPLGVAQFLGLTKGTVSQSLKHLEAKGLIEKRPDGRDGRVTHLQPTRSGRRLVDNNVPPPPMQAVFDMMDKEARLDLTRELSSVLQKLQLANQSRSFGVCATCRFHLRDQNGSTCALTGEHLAAAEHVKICREHESEGPGASQV